MIEQYLTNDNSINDYLRMIDNIPGLIQSVEHDKLCGLSTDILNFINITYLYQDNLVLQIHLTKHSNKDFLLNTPYSFITFSHISFPEISIDKEHLPSIDFLKSFIFNIMNNIRNFNTKRKLCLINEIS